MQYSHSKITTYHTCPRQFRYQYIDLHDTKEKQKLPLILGKAVHHVLELFVRQQLKQTAHTWWQEIYHSYRQEHLAEIPDHPDMIDTYRKRGEQHITWYIDTYYPQETSVPILVEQHLHIARDKHKRCTGIIDRIDRRQEDLFIIDYKTSTKKRTQKYRDQLTLYALRVQQKFKGTYQKLYGNIIYLELQEDDTFEITQTMMENIQQQHRATIASIENDANQYAWWRGEEEAFTPTPWSHCTHCPFVSLCPAYTHEPTPKHWEQAPT